MSAQYSTRRNRRWTRELIAMASDRNSLATAILLDIVPTFWARSGVGLDPLWGPGVFPGVLDPRRNERADQRPMVRVKPTAKTEWMGLSASDDRDFCEKRRAPATRTGNSFCAARVGTEFEVWVRCDVGLSAEFFESIDNGLSEGGRAIKWEGSRQTVRRWAHLPI